LEIYAQTCRVKDLPGCSRISGNQVTPELTIIPSGEGFSAEWRPKMPKNGSLLSEVEEEIQRYLSQNPDRDWLVNLDGEKVTLAEVK